MPLPMQIVVLFFGLIGFICIWLGVDLFVRSRRARTWPRVRATVLAASVEEPVPVSVPPGIDGARRPEPAAEMEIRYAYEVDGKRYESTAYRLQGNEVLDDGAEERRRYAAGRQVTVAYNPARPEEAVIHTRVAMLEIVTLLLGGALFAGIGVVQAGRMLGLL